jgi:hypothetical protein
MERTAPPPWRRPPVSTPSWSLRRGIAHGLFAPSREGGAAPDQLMKATFVTF